jgi:hypothetical protein
MKRPDGECAGLITSSILAILPLAISSLEHNSSGELCWS